MSALPYSCFSTDFRSNFLPKRGIFKFPEYLVYGGYFLFFFNLNAIFGIANDSHKNTERFLQISLYESLLFDIIMANLSLTDFWIQSTTFSAS